MSLIANSIRGSRNIITGCAKGLGKATLERFLIQGSGQILAIDRKFKPDFIDSLDVPDDKKSNIVLGCYDTFDEQSVTSSLEKFVSNHGTFDNLVNVAGISLAFSFFIKNQDPNKVRFYSLNHANCLLEFNTVGTFNMLRLAARYMIDENTTAKQTASGRSKCIVNTSCVSTTKPSIGQSFYAASKSAIDSMTLCVAREFSPVNIRCNTINVGYFNTPLLQNTDDRVTDYLVKEVIQCPQRLGHPDEFAHLVQAIIENKMINGTCIKIDAATETALTQVGGRSTGQM